MIALADVYKFVEAMAPLYFALMLGYGCVRWWRIITPQECAVVNRFVCYFILPLLTFECTIHVDPYNMNYRFIGADILSKLIVVFCLAIWAVANRKSGSCFSWCITSFALCTITNTFIVGVPLMRPMYGDMGVNLLIQSFVFQCIIWLTILLLILEFRSAGGSGEGNNNDLEANNSSGRPSFLHLMKAVGVKFAKNPNCYACVLGLAWTLTANRWQFEMPMMIEGCVLVMSKGATGTGMFSLGLFMAQEKLIPCGPKLTILGMIFKFVAGPAAVAIGGLAVGLRGDVLRVAIIQAALPQAITSFIFAKEYGLHADVVSTSVIFGTIVSVPVLIAYYAVLDLIP